MLDALEVLVDIDGAPVTTGLARFSARRGALVTSFSYDAGYLARRGAYPLDPELPLTSGAHHASGLPGAFADCAPDRWGRNLIAKRIATQDRDAGRTASTVTDVDYLVGVSDLTRQGALRFRVPGSDGFVDPAHDVPKLIELPRLLRAADRLAGQDATPEDIATLLAAGTGTLGGARPKSSVRGDDGRLFIAKFPKPSDDWDVMAWEKTALDLAESAGIAVPGRRLLRVGGHQCLLLDRFDREGPRRRGYISAMTLMSARDGDAHDYVELAEQVAESSANTVDDLRQLYRRIAFSVAVRNTDDHLRNHGFLRAGPGWTLSPAFDINPNPDPGERRTTSIAGATGADDEIDGLQAAAADFRLGPREARLVVDEVLAAAAGWREAAAANGIPAGEIRRFSGAFALTTTKG